MRYINPNKRPKLIRPTRSNPPRRTSTLEEQYYDEQMKNSDYYMQMVRDGKPSGLPMQRYPGDGSIPNMPRPTLDDRLTPADPLGVGVDRPSLYDLPTLPPGHFAVSPAQYNPNQPVTAGTQGDAGPMAVPNLYVNTQGDAGPMMPVGARTGGVMIPKYKPNQPVTPADPLDSYTFYDPLATPLPSSSPQQFGKGGGAPTQPPGPITGGSFPTQQPQSQQFGKGGGAPTQPPGPITGGSFPTQQPQSQQFGKGGGAPTQLQEPITLGGASGDEGVVGNLTSLGELAQKGNAELNSALYGGSLNLYGGGSVGRQMAGGGSTYTSEPPMSGLSSVLAMQGRLGDSTLVHMNPMEVEMLKTMSPDGNLSYNPETGLPEAFKLRDIAAFALPIAAAVAAPYLLPAIGITGVGGVTAGAIGAGVGGVGAGLIQGKGLKDSLVQGGISGLMSYGMGSMMAPGTVTGGAEAIQGGVTSTPALGADSMGLGGYSAAQEAAVTQGLGAAGIGAPDGSSLIAPGTPTSSFADIGFGPKDSVQYTGASDIYKPGTSETGIGQMFDRASRTSPFGSTAFDGSQLGPTQLPTYTQIGGSALGSAGQMYMDSMLSPEEMPYDIADDEAYYDTDLEGGRLRGRANARTLKRPFESIDPSEYYGMATSPGGIGTFYAADGGRVPKDVDINGQPHQLSYINQKEADLLRSMGGSGQNVYGIPAYYDANDDASISDSVGGDNMNWDGSLGTDQKVQKVSPITSDSNMNQNMTGEEPQSLDGQTGTGYFSSGLIPVAGRPTQTNVGIDNSVYGNSFGDPYNTGTKSMAQGGGIASLAYGGNPPPADQSFEGMVPGNGTGMSDDVPFSIEGDQPALLSRDEYVLPADVVSQLGDGSSGAGSDMLDNFISKVRHTKYGNTQQPPPVGPELMIELMRSGGIV